MYMLHVYGYCYFGMNPFIYIMYLFVYVLYVCFSKSSMCIYFNCMHLEKFMWHSLVGCWVCYNMFRRENESVLSCIVARPGWLETLQSQILCTGGVSCGIPQLGHMAPYHLSNK
jgi:hypothetical protein